MQARWLCVIPAAVLAAVSGCTKSETFSATDKPPSALFTNHDIKKPDQQAPRRTPQSETCARGGAVLEQGGDEAKDPNTRTSSYRRAQLAYQQAIDIEPKNRAGLLGLGRLQSKEGNHPKAIEYFQIALQTYPQDAELWHELGMCSARQKQWDQAIASLNKALQLDPRNPTFSNNYGWTLARAGYQQESLDHFARTVGAARAHYNLARMSMHLGNGDLCRQHLEAALQAEQNFPEAQQLLAQLAGGDANIRQATVDIPR